MFDNARAHPWQTLLGIGAGTLIPGAGFALGRGFNAWNNHQFNNAVTQAGQNTATAGNQAMNQAMGQPLGGVLGMVGQGGSAPGTGWNMSSMYSAPNNNWSQPSNPGGLLDFLGPAPTNGPGGSFANGTMGGGGGSDAGGDMGGGGGFGGLGGGSLPGGGSMGYMNGASAQMAHDFQPLFVRRVKPGGSK